MFYFLVKKFIQSSWAVLAAFFLFSNLLHTVFPVLTNFHTPFYVYHIVSFDFQCCEVSLRVTFMWCFWSESLSLEYLHFITILFLILVKNLTLTQFLWLHPWSFSDSGGSVEFPWSFMLDLNFVLSIITFSSLLHFIFVSHFLLSVE